jgi:beta-phosphoglucomutase-like phosphatase (HAD superfamily)
LLAVTGGKERISHYLAHFDPPAAERVATPEVIAGLHRAKTRHYTALLARGGIPLRPGIERLLREARDAGLRLAIATTTTPENVYALLDSTLGAGARGWFEVIGAGDIVPAKKPAPDIYDWVLERLALAPDRCMALEDSDNGLKAAYGAGIRSVLITVNGYTRGQDFAAAPWVLEDLGEPGRPPLVVKGTVETDDGVTVADLRRMHEGVATNS